MMDAGGSTSGGGSVPRIMVFRPTWDEFKDFNNYIIYMEKCGAHKAGLAKIVPPPEWNPCPGGYDFDTIGEMEIPAPISQVVQGKQGIYQLFNILKKPMKVKDFRRMAESPRYATPVHTDYEDLDRKYWKNIAFTPAIYGADVSGSLTDPAVKEWNINKLGSILDYVNEDYGISIDGVNTAYLYYGMWKSSFAWHTEDMDLYSINYLHFGEPKSWFCVPPEYGARLERLANNNFQSNFKECPAYLRHKMTVLSPNVLKTHSIPFNKIVQEAGEFMITFPFGYHAGYNHGYNCAESTNFASPRWVEYGKRATQCACRPDMVKISMDTFVHRFQPEKYDLWLAGKDIGCHPEIPGRLSAAPHPSREEVLVNKIHNQSIPESFVEPVKKKAKRHLVHKLGKDYIQPETPPPDLTAEPEYMDEELNPSCSTDEDSLYEEEAESDEEKFEVMKDVLYKAGEMDSDGLDEWQPGSSKKKSSKSTTKKIVSKSSGTESPPPIPEFKKRRPQLSATLVVQPVPLNGFRIPKKNNLSPYPDEGLPSRWTDEENSASQALLNLCTVKKEENHLTAIKRHPPALVRYGPSNEGQSVRRNSFSPPPLTVAAGTSKTVPVLSMAIKVEQPDCSQQNERRSRKQKMPKSNKVAQAVTSFTSERLFSLWSSQRDWTVGREAEFNFLGSQTPPYCSICALVYLASGTRLYQQHESLGHQPPTSSAVLIPSEVFTRSPIQQTGATNSAIIKCSICRITVHASCYGVDPSALDSTPWKCRRCERSDANAKCCLCLQKGGALKPTSDSRWAHISCGLCLPEVTFGVPSAREPVIVTNVGKSAPMFSSCVYCSDSSSSDNAGSVFYHGVCVKCIRPGCNRSFHPICGQLNKVRFRLDYKNGLILPDCCGATAITTTPTTTTVKREPPIPVSGGRLQVGLQVYAKHPKTGLHALSEVIDNKCEATHYSVDFEDGTFSKDVLPEDITNYECLKRGAPPLGAAVAVRWTDGNMYRGNYRGQNQVPVYRLRFFGSSVLTEITAERSEIDLEDELPRAVRERFQCKSEIN